MSTTSPLQNSDSPRGLILALLTYGLWGALPIYMKAMTGIPATEIIAHRIIWSLPIAAGVLIWQRRISDVTEALRRPRLLAMAALTAILISTNWLIYVWAVTHDRALEAALGYYINPLFLIALGALLLGERLSRLQWVAVALAAAAVAVLTWQAGSIPLVALGLTFSWGFYAFFKRSLPLGPNQGFTLEVILLTPFALGFLIWLQTQGTSHLTTSPHLTILLLGCGMVTAVPLLLYANAAKQVRLSTMGLLQYITPTLIAVIAVLAFGEPVTRAEAIAFPMIWAALAIYSITLIRAARHRRRTRRELAQQRAQ